MDEACPLKDSPSWKQKPAAHGSHTSLSHSATGNIATTLTSPQLDQLSAPQGIECPGAYNSVKGGGTKNYLSKYYEAYCQG